jgi:hypothetical protein
MEFILEHQAQFAVSIQRLQEERVRDQPRLAQLEESFQLLVQLGQTSDSRFDSLEANQVRDQLRQTRLEESFQLLVQLGQTSDSRFDSLEANQSAISRDRPDWRNHSSCWCNWPRLRIRASIRLNQTWSNLPPIWLILP